MPNRELMQRDPGAYLNSRNLDLAVPFPMGYSPPARHCSAQTTLRPLLMRLLILPSLPSYPRIATVRAARRTAKVTMLLLLQNVALGLIVQPPRRAASASWASWCRNAKNAGDWPMKSPMSVKNLTTPMAIPFVLVGRMIEHLGSVRLRNGHGSGMIRLV